MPPLPAGFSGCAVTCDEEAACLSAQAISMCTARRATSACGPPPSAPPDVTGAAASLIVAAQADTLGRDCLSSTALQHLRICASTQASVVPVCVKMCGRPKPIQFPPALRRPSLTCRPAALGCRGRCGNGVRMCGWEGGPPFPSLTCRPAMPGRRGRAARPASRDAANRPQADEAGQSRQQGGLQK